MKKILTIRKIALFYDAYDDDAQILSYLLGYKIIKGRVGFPENAVHKVMNTLDSHKINYKIIGDQEEIKDFKNLNQYSKILAKSRDKIEIEDKVEKMIQKINTLDSESLCEILDRMEHMIHEYE